MGTLANSEDPDEMQYMLHIIWACTVCLDLKQPSGTEIHVHHNFENSYCDPLKYTIGSPILIVSSLASNHSSQPSLQRHCLSPNNLTLN